MPWGVAAAAVSLYGASQSADAAKDAANTQAGSARDANALSSSQYQQSRNDQAPYREAGAAGLNQLQTLLGVGGHPELQGVSVDDLRNQIAGLDQQSAALVANPAYFQKGAAGDKLRQDGVPISQQRTKLNEQIDWVNQSQAAKANGQFGSLTKPFTLQDFQSSPGYEFAKQQGQEAIQNSAGARGMQLSPNTLKDLDSFTTGLANQDYGNAFNRDLSTKQNTFSQLASLAGIGQSSTNMTNTLGANAATQQGQNTIGAGNAQAAGIIGATNATNSGMNGAVNQYLQMQTLQNLFGSNSSSISGSLY